jgi:hypothetical protein
MITPSWRAAAKAERAVETAQTRGWFARRANLSQSALLIPIPNQKQNPHVSSHMSNCAES